MRICDWSSYVCSSDLVGAFAGFCARRTRGQARAAQRRAAIFRCDTVAGAFGRMLAGGCWRDLPERFGPYQTAKRRYYRWIAAVCSNSCWILREDRPFARSEEHTSELQSLMRISYAVFCLKKKKIKKRQRRGGNKSRKNKNTGEAA